MGALLRNSSRPMAKVPEDAIDHLYTIIDLQQRYIDVLIAASNRVPEQ